MYPWISHTLNFWLQFCEKKCGLYMDVYGIHFLLTSHVYNSFSQDLATWVIYKIKSQTEQNIHLLNSTHLNFTAINDIHLLYLSITFSNAYTTKFSIHISTRNLFNSDRTFMTKSHFFFSREN